MRERAGVLIQTAALVSVLLESLEQLDPPVCGEQFVGELRALIEGVLRELEDEAAPRRLLAAPPGVRRAQYLYDGEGPEAPVIELASRRAP